MHTTNQKRGGAPARGGFSQVPVTSGGGVGCLGSGFKLPYLWGHSANGGQVITSAQEVRSVDLQLKVAQPLDNGLWALQEKKKGGNGVTVSVSLLQEPLLSRLELRRWLQQPEAFSHRNTNPLLFCLNPLKVDLLNLSADKTHIDTHTQPPLTATGCHLLSFIAPITALYSMLMCNLYSRNEITLSLACLPWRNVAY